MSQSQLHTIIIPKIHSFPFLAFSFVVTFIVSHLPWEQITHKMHVLQVQLINIGLFKKGFRFILNAVVFCRGTTRKFLPY
ncbi:hypothetical protein EUGRSUZ_H04362 [Eucalyptus grandis]|uniref:Uncharacterized protein n=2 Tax=Eucalyptus grandis TaxID=71139 RepID=A0ACC3JWI3_EUCGR|nr:hypothetical protein EUGRSUZ_H04362 [Eucalyptus grandis]